VFMIRVFEIFERFGRMFHKFVCSTFWGLGLMEKERMVGLDRLHNHIRKNGNVEEKPRRKRTVGLFSNISNRLCIKSWSLLWFISVVRGGRVIVFLPFHMRRSCINMIGLRLQKSILLLCIRAGRKSSSPGKELQFHIPLCNPRCSSHLTGKISGRIGSKVQT
jgi:hypothetical protein